MLRPSPNDETLWLPNDDDGCRLQVDCAGIIERLQNINRGIFAPVNVINTANTATTGKRSTSTFV